MPSHHYSRIFSIAGLVIGGLLYWWISSLALFAVILVSAMLIGIYMDKRLHSLVLVGIAIALIWASGAAVIFLGWGYQFGAISWCLIPTFTLVIDSLLYGSRGDQSS